MKCPCSCGEDHAADVIAQAPSRRALGSRFIGLVDWAVPVTVLALVPKCPACVAAYVLLLTGVGVSVPTATAVRWVLMGLGVTLLVVLSVRDGRRILRWARL